MKKTLVKNLAPFFFLLTFFSCIKQNSNHTSIEAFKSDKLLNNIITNIDSYKSALGNNDIQEIRNSLGIIVNSSKLLY